MFRAALEPVVVMVSVVVTVLPPVTLNVPGEAEQVGGFEAVPPFVILMVPKLPPPAPGDTAATPEPLRVTVVVDVTAVVVKVSVPVAASAVVGANVTVAVQDAETARLPQVLVCVKPPLVCTAVMVSGVAAVLVRVTFCDTELPRTTSPKLMEDGVTVGAVGPVMVMTTGLEVAVGKLASPVKVATMEFDPIGRFVRFSSAVPLFSVAVPSVVEPLVKATVLPLVVRLPLM